MGIAEKRALKEAQDKIPGRQDELKEISGGAEVVYEVSWDSFADDAKGSSWLDMNGPHQVSCAFRRICKDDIGRDAIKEGLKKVAIVNLADAGEKKLAFADGVLQLHCAFAQSPKGRFTDVEIAKILEENL